jgi:hypothetical protein
LQVAVCLRDWDHAVDLIGNLIASPDISSEQRSHLVGIRHQLQETLLRHEAIPVSLGQCETLLAVYGQPLPTVVPSLDWQRGFYSALITPNFNPVPDQTARQQAAAQQAGLTQMVDTEIPALSPANILQTRTGSGVSAGAVSTGVNVFVFSGAVGDRVSLDVKVTNVHPGRLYTDDDSQLFLFDSEGTLLVENDDLSRLQSQIAEFALPQTGAYYIAVTTYNNDPILDSAQRITGWNGNGGSNIEYTLTVTGLTPTADLLLPVVSSQPES